MEKLNNETEKRGRIHVLPLFFWDLLLNIQRVTHFIPFGFQV